MSEAEKARESQVELLVRQLVEVLSRDEKSNRVLAFDVAVGKRLQEAGQEVEVVEPEGPWPEEAKYDLVLCLGCLEKVTEERVALRRVKESLEADGLAVIAVPLARPGSGPPDGCLRTYSDEELSSLLFRSGMSVSEVLSEGPEQIIVETRASEAVGADTIAEADQAISDKRWDDAERLLGSITEQMEDELLVRELAMLVGHVHLARGRLQQALEAFEQASGLGEAAAQPLIGLGAVALAAGDMEAASELFSAALEHLPTSYFALRGMGMVKKELGDAEGALTSFDMAATQRPAEKEVAEQVVDLALEVGWAGSSRQAIDRYVRATGDEKWATQLANRLAGTASANRPPSEEEE